MLFWDYFGVSIKNSPLIKNRKLYTMSSRGETMKPREPELEGKVFCDPKTKEPYEGLRLIMIPDDTMPTYHDITKVWYEEGKLHGTPAIAYSDGQEEDWLNGTFVRVSRLPFHQR